MAPLPSITVILLASSKPTLQSQCLINRRQACISSIIAPVVTSFLPAESSWSEEYSTGLVHDGSEKMERIESASMVTLPLEVCPGGALCLRATIMGPQQQVTSTRSLVGRRTISRTPYRVYRLIVDTGSPYLVVSGSANNRGEVITAGYLDDDSNDDSNTPKWSTILELIQQTLGIMIPPDILQADDVEFNFVESEYAPTEEIYGSQKGYINWNLAQINFRDQRLMLSTNDQGNVKGGIVLGVMDDVLAKESGGSLIGLVKRSNIESTKIQRRPTFLEQERLSIVQNSNQCVISSFRIDYPNKELVLSSKALIPHNVPNAFPLVDLRPLGDFVEHYACKVDEIVFDGNVLVSSQILSTKIQGKRDIVAVFDSGLTGCLLIEPFWVRLQEEGLDPSSFKSVEIRTKVEKNSKEKKRYTSNQNVSTLPSVCSIMSSSDMNRLFYVSPISLDWFDDEDTAPYVIVLGQTFLIQGSLTVDVDDRRATFSAMSKV